MYGRTRAAGFGAEVKRRIMLGTYALSAGYYDAYYGQAQRVRTLIIRDFEAAYDPSTCCCRPTTPTTAFALGAKTSDPLAMYLSDVCTIPSNLAGHPAMTVPFGTGRPTACPSASRSWPPPSAKPSCSRSPPPWKRRGHGGAVGEPDAQPPRPPQTPTTTAGRR